jgi:hypothetical protein
MRQLKNPFLLLAIASVVILASCKKNKSDSPTVSPEECLTGNSSRSGQIIEGQYIVSLRGTTETVNQQPNIIQRKLQQILDRKRINSASIKKSLGNKGQFLARLSNAEVEALKNDEEVGIVEPDRIVALNTCFTVVEPRSITWSVARVGYGDGRGKTAWVVDSGIDFDHPDLTVDRARSRSFINGDQSAEDAHGHGTHVAGIIGAKNNNIGILGVASGANLVSIRVLDEEGEGTLSSIIQALSYINENAKAGDVVNLSLGEEIVSETLDQQVKNTASRGILIAIAAGNDNKPAREFSPARANAANIFTVSATDSLDNFASFSNYGNDVVDVAAPGVLILSTFTNGRYAKMSGTSMAAPHVAGLLLLKGRNISSSGSAKNDPDGNGDPIAHL